MRYMIFTWMQVIDLPLPIHSRAVTRVQERRSSSVVNLVMMIVMGMMMRVLSDGDDNADQGGRSCAGARVAPAEKFGLGRTYAILSRIKICRDLRTFFWRSLGIKSAFLGKNSASWARSALLHGIYCIFY